jgi:hypothetical protein
MYQQKVRKIVKSIPMRTRNNSLDAYLEGNRVLLVLILLGSSS